MNSIVGMMSSLLSLHSAPSVQAVTSYEAALYFPQKISTTSEAVCDKGFQAFKDNVYPFIRANCATCHDVNATGPAQGPAHSVSDPELSYRRVSSYMNFDSLDASQFLIKGGDQHCIKYGVKCEVDAAKLKPHLQDWLSMGEKDCTHGFKLTSAGFTLPADLPNASTGDHWKTMRFKLDSMGDVYDGLFIEMDVQQYVNANDDHPGAYRFKNPRLATPDQTFLVKGMHILVNNKHDPRENIFNSINTRIDAHEVSVNVGAKDFPLLSIKTMIVVQDKPSGDVISIAFDKLEPAQNAYCKATETFKAKVLPVLMKRGCFDCHGTSGSVSSQMEGTSAAAVRAMNFKGSDLKACSQILQRVNWTDFLISPIIQIPLNGLNQHGRFLPFSREIFPDWTDWMKEEKANGGF